MGEDKQILKGLNVGDEVVLTIRNNSRIAKITKITPTQIEASGLRFYKSSGRLRTSDKWLWGKIEIPTEEDYKFFRIGEKRVELCRKVRALQEIIFKLSEEDVTKLLKEIDLVLQERQ